MCYNIARMSEKLTCQLMGKFLSKYNFEKSTRVKFSFFLRFKDYDGIVFSLTSRCAHENDTVGFSSVRATIDGVVENISGKIEIGELHYLGKTSGHDYVSWLTSVASKFKEAVDYVKKNFSRVECKTCGGTISLDKGCVNRFCYTHIQPRKAGQAMYSRTIAQEKEDTASPEQKRALRNYSAVFENNGITQYALGEEVISMLTREQASKTLDRMKDVFNSVVKGKITPRQTKHIINMTELLRKHRFSKGLLAKEEIEKLTFEEASNMIGELQPLADEIHLKYATQVRKPVQKAEKPAVRLSVTEIMKDDDGMF